MKFIKKNLWVVLFIVMFLVIVVPVVSLAQGETNPTPTGENEPVKLKNPLGDDTKDFEAVLKKLLVGVIQLGIPIVALAIIYSGFLFVKAQGNPEELTKAKEALLYSLIGGAILLGAWGITEVVFDTVKSLAS